MKNFLGLVILISMDNGIPMKPLEEIEFPDDFGFDWQELDEKATRLNPVEAETFCCGEESEANELAKKYDLHDLSNCLNQIFDGDLGPYFWAV